MKTVSIQSGIKDLVRINKFINYTKIMHYKFENGTYKR